MKTSIKDAVYEIADHLLSLGEGKDHPRYKAQGICAEIKDHSSITRIKTPSLGYIKMRLIVHVFEHHMNEWPKASGTPQYPVPSPVRHLNAYEVYHSYSDLWNINTEYGRNRLELCRWLSSERDAILDHVNQLLTR